MYVQPSAVVKSMLKASTAPSTHRLASHPLPSPWPTAAIHASLELLSTHQLSFEGLTCLFVTSTIFPSEVGYLDERTHSWLRLLRPKSPNASSVAPTVAIDAPSIIGWRCLPRFVSLYHMLTPIQASFNVLHGRAAAIVYVPILRCDNGDPTPDITLDTIHNERGEVDYTRQVPLLSCFLRVFSLYPWSADLSPPLVRLRQVTAHNPQAPASANASSVMIRRAALMSIVYGSAIAAGLVPRCVAVQQLIADFVAELEQHPFPQWPQLSLSREQQLHCAKLMMQTSKLWPQSPVTSAHIPVLSLHYVLAQLLPLPLLPSTSPMQSLVEVNDSILDTSRITEPMRVLLTIQALVVSFSWSLCCFLASGRGFILPVAFADTPRLTTQGLMMALPICHAFRSTTTMVSNVASMLDLSCSFNGNIPDRLPVPPNHVCLDMGLFAVVLAWLTANCPHRTADLSVADFLDSLLVPMPTDALVQIFDMNSAAAQPFGGSASALPAWVQQYGAMCSDVLASTLNFFERPALLQFISGSPQISLPPPSAVPIVGTVAAPTASSLPSQQVPAQAQAVPQPMAIPPPPVQQPMLPQSQLPQQMAQTGMMASQPQLMPSDRLNNLPFQQPLRVPRGAPVPEFEPADASRNNRPLSVAATPFTPAALAPWSLSALPIDSFYQRITESALAPSSISWVVGSSGCGKSLRVPLMLLQESEKRVTADPTVRPLTVIMAVASRLNVRSLHLQMSNEWRQLHAAATDMHIGWAIEQDRHFDGSTRCLIVTHEWLVLQVLQDAAWLDKFTHVILDDGLLGSFILSLVSCLLE